MTEIIIHQEKIADVDAVLKLCPFGAIEVNDGKVAINAGCRMCRICIKKGPAGAFELIENDAPAADKSKWRGIAVVAEVTAGKLHPVSFELLGKARELAEKSAQEVYAVVFGFRLAPVAEELLDYGADKVVVYDQPELEHFRIEPYTAALEDFINAFHPSVVLVGGTTVGRSLAPRTAARFRTGLTADCTILDIQPDTDLDQIRPAYGGNIMAHINTPRHRPQFATVRYKIFSIPEKCRRDGAEVIQRKLAPSALGSGINVLEVKPKPPVKMLEDAEIIVAAGRGVKKPEDLAMLHELAELLSGQLASSRALVECGWVPAGRQIGLSGRTVKPKLIITCGISGAIQFAAGMNNSEFIVAINSNPEAAIFKIAHVGICGDLYSVVPRLIERLKGSMA